jgi:hypothetical protein
MDDLVTYRVEPVNLVRSNTGGFTRTIGRMRNSRLLSLGFVPLVTDETEETEASPIREWLKSTIRLPKYLATTSDNKHGNAIDKVMNNEFEQLPFFVTKSGWETSLCDGSRLRPTRNSKAFHPVRRARVKNKDRLLMDLQVARLSREKSELKENGSIQTELRV